MSEIVGGEYLFISNASRSLAQVIFSVVIGYMTLRQCFIFENLAMVNRNDNINEQNQATDGVGDLPFDHGLSY